MNIDNWSRDYQCAAFLGIAMIGCSSSKLCLNEISILGDNVPMMAFRACPFNNTFGELIRGMRIYELAKPNDRKIWFASAIKEFLALASDFIPPCCGDGRTFYVINDTLRVPELQCDRCDAIYSLEGDKRPIGAGYRIMNRKDFHEIIPDIAEEKWPFVESISKKFNRQEKGGGDS